MTTEQLQKLPKWAQEEFKSLKRENSLLSAENKALLGNNEASRVSYTTNTLDGNKIFIPNDRDVRFDLGKGDSMGNDVRYIDAEIKEEFGELVVHLRGSDSISLEANYSNTLTVKLRR